MRIIIYAHVCWQVNKTSDSILTRSPFWAREANKQAEHTSASFSLLCHPHCRLRARNATSYHTEDECQGKLQISSPAWRRHCISWIQIKNSQHTWTADLQKVQDFQASSWQPNLVGTSLSLNRHKDRSASSSGSGHPGAPFLPMSSPTSRFFWSQRRTNVGSSVQDPRHVPS